MPSSAVATDTFSCGPYRFLTLGSETSLNNVKYLRVGALEQSAREVIWSLEEPLGSSESHSLWLSC